MSQKRIYATLVFPFNEMTEEDQQRVHQAERLLHQAGVSFGVGSDLDEGRATSRDWFLDFELDGAKLVTSARTSPHGDH